MVSLTVTHENPELEQRKKMLLETEEQLKNKLTKLEETLLSTLGNSTGNILENQVRNFTFNLNLNHFNEI